ncbi:hypothetical protein STBHUCCB_p390 (plasmid) [Salmonella enterica subsp. enterica serovar Typhi str. P-stx-12]|nr:hypothetical protein STBHUCCB_p390 [Salmonella enterica subsp. enterica serovar Typhi str. P-stx-12]
MDCLLHYLKTYYPYFGTSLFQQSQLFLIIYRLFFFHSVFDL